MIRFEKYMSAKAIFASDECAAVIETGKAFSVMICGGKAEVFFKKIDGAWKSRVMTVDKIFGYINSRWTAV